MRLFRKIAAAALILTIPFYGSSFASAGVTGVPVANGVRPKIVLPLIGGTPTGVTGLQVFGNAANALPFPINSATTKAPVAGYGIQFNGGNVMNNPNGVNVYLVWYGNWGSDTAKTIIPTFITNLSNSPRFNINKTYSDGNGLALTGKINLRGEYSYPTTTLGTSLSDANIATLANGALGQGSIPATLDPNGIYLVLTAAGIAETSGFLSVYCGWHDSTNMNNQNPAVPESQNMKFAFIGNPGGVRGCAYQTTSSPNNNPGADGMLSVITHELEETITDPDGKGWYVSDLNNPNLGMENSDLCAWTWGTITTLSTNSALGIANIVSATNNSFTGSATVQSATNNSFTGSATVQSATNNSSANRAGTTITYTTSAAHNFLAGDKVTIPSTNAAYAVTAAATIASVQSPTSFTISKATSAGTAALAVSTTATVSRAGTTITYTTSAAHNFLAGDKVTIPSTNAAYAVTTAATIGSVQSPTSFTINKATTAGTAALSVATTATGTRSTSFSYNLTLNGAKYLIQQNWANRSSRGICAMS